MVYEERRRKRDTWDGSFIIDPFSVLRSPSPLQSPCQSPAASIVEHLRRWVGRVRNTIKARGGDVQISPPCELRDSEGTSRHVSPPRYSCYPRASLRVRTHAHSRTYTTHTYTHTCASTHAQTHVREAWLHTSRELPYLIKQRVLIRPPYTFPTREMTLSI